jgi:hypothetical protein
LPAQLVINRDLRGRQRTHRRGTREHRRAVALFGPDAGDTFARGRHLHEGAHLLAFDHHVLVMRADAAGFEPGLAEKLAQQRVELAEMGGPFDRPGAQPQRRGSGVIVDRLVAVVDLLGQHLPRLAQRAAQVGALRKRVVHARVLSISVCGNGRALGSHCPRAGPIPSGA